MKDFAGDVLKIKEVSFERDIIPYVTKRVSDLDSVDGPVHRLFGSESKDIGGSGPYFIHDKKLRFFSKEKFKSRSNPLLRSPLRREIHRGYT